MDWLGFLSDPNFMPHGHCYFWRPDILWTHVVSDLVITVAYYAIPMVLGIFLYKRRASIPYSGILALFVAFILLCGTTHLLQIYVTWYPAYEIQGWLKALTAVVSILTALVLAPKLPELIALPGIKQAYQDSEVKLEKAIEKLKQSEHLTHQALNREMRIIELKQEVNDMLVAMGQERKYLVDEAPGADQ